ncbi:hypothetical protein VIGAN_UM014000 [Vigna angularis var. angularis]|uniref:Uncharacterized protein n=1 Tax=Vigna angularis var. angularis TaxID=157739 RepID=A0A0S3TDS3_PHAAN|nr:hypothetical protein VIGAN_UM014000 [Vigna angularis var. angularis]
MVCRILSFLQPQLLACNQLIHTSPIKPAAAATPKLQPPLSVSQSSSSSAFHHPSSIFIRNQPAAGALQQSSMGKKMRSSSSISSSCSGSRSNQQFQLRIIQLQRRPVHVPGPKPVAVL